MNTHVTSNPPSAIGFTKEDLDISLEVIKLCMDFNVSPEKLIKGMMAKHNIDEKEASMLIYLSLRQGKLF